MAALLKLRLSGTAFRFNARFGIDRHQNERMRIERFLDLGGILKLDGGCESFRFFLRQWGAEEVESLGKPARITGQRLALDLDRLILLTLSPEVTRKRGKQQTE